MGQASPQPMVMTTSAALTNSSVRGLGNSLGHVDSHLVHHPGDRRVYLVGGRTARRSDLELALRMLRQQTGSHLPPACVMNADERDVRRLLDEVMELGRHRCPPDDWPLPWLPGPD